MHSIQGWKACLLVAVAVLGFGKVAAQTPARDAISDSVGATFGEFRVDESGNASYSIPIYAPPGTAGVVPRMSLAYNSGGGIGPLGKGWSISGQSAISRCRKTREAGDFTDGQGNPIDGNSQPVSYTNADVFCLDGQRMLLVSGTYGAAGAEYRLELDPFTQIFSVGGNNGSTSSYTGPTSFTVRRKDGSTSTYGETEDAKIERCIFCDVNQAIAIWALSSVQDSVGNYISYTYIDHPFTGGGGPVGDYVEYVISSVRFTGKRQLPGQSTPASSPYAGIFFNYRSGGLQPSNGEEVTAGYQGGVLYSQSQLLESIVVKDQIDLPLASQRTLRFYRFCYSSNQAGCVGTETSMSGSRAKLLRSIQECRDESMSVCYRPTVFSWTDQLGVKSAFETGDTSSTVGETRNLVSSRIGDVDGDGRMDIVWFRSAGSTHPTCSNKRYLVVSFADREVVASQSRLTLKTFEQTTVCTSLDASATNDELNTAWGLFDFNGDGRDDLMLADNNDGTPNARWHIYASGGRPQSGTSVFDTSTDLMNVTISTASDSQDQAQFGDFNGDGMIDIAYSTGSSSLGIAFMQRKADQSGFEFSQPISLLPQINCPSDSICNVDYQPGDVSGFGVSGDFNGDGRSDLIVRVKVASGSLGPEELSTPIRNLDNAAFEEYVAERSLAITETKFVALVMGSRTASTQSAQQYGPGPIYSAASDLGSADVRQFQVVDVNADGLADLVYQMDLTSDDYTFALSTGKQFQMSGGRAASGSISDVSNRAHLRFVDVTGDGRLDIVYPSGSESTLCDGTSVSGRVFRYRAYSSSTLYGLNGGYDLPGSSSPSGDARCVPGFGAKAEVLSQWDYFFADFDGDGAADFIKLRNGDAQGNVPSSMYSSRAFPLSRFKPRDAIFQVSSGYGAVTQFGYQPITNKAVYRRGRGSRLDPAPDGSASDVDGVVDSWGRGSTVIDVLSSQYVVSTVESSAPTRGQLAARSRLLYRYAGQKIQAGGRGSLGFRTIDTIDANAVSGDWILTEQIYRQDFPFIGLPLQTLKYRIPGAVTLGSAELDQCALDPESLAQVTSFPGDGVHVAKCFYDLSAVNELEHPAPFGEVLQGRLVRVSSSLWGCKANGTTEACDFSSSASPNECPEVSAAVLSRSVHELAPASRLVVGVPRGLHQSALNGQQALFAYTTRTFDADLDPSTGAISRNVCGLFSYAGDSYGNATTISLSTFSGASLTTLVAKKITINAYVNDVVNWRLGRLVSSLVTDTRGTQTSSRVSDFSYDIDGQAGLSSTDSGLLLSERIQKDVAANQDLRTIYSLDDYGNRVEAFTCSKQRQTPSGLVEFSDADCKNKLLIEQRPVGSGGPTTAVHRYSRNVYVQNGRYLSSTYKTFFSPTAARGVAELALETVNGRDEFGNPVSVSGANGLVGTSLFGAMNRAYYVADNTGKSSTTTFRWCGSSANEVSCPSGGSFRQRTQTAGAPDTYVYFDVLGRQVLSVAQSFNANIAGKNWSSTCTTYDSHGRVEHVSIPFFLAGAGSDPDFAQNPTVCTNAFSGTSNSYDALGRVIRVSAADGSFSTSSFAGLTTTTIDSRGQNASQTKNALGEVVYSVQADPASGGLSGASMQVTNEYDPQGNLRFVRRNAGNGEVVSEVQYDSLGRKVLVLDPDRGAMSYEYNAAGEVIRSTNALNTRVEQDYDALGRVWRRRAGNAQAFTASDLTFRSGFENEISFGGAVLVDEWQFDTAANGLGALHFEQRSISSQVGIAFQRTNSYDGIGRLSQRLTSFDGNSYSESTTYDGVGRIQTQTDASGDVTSYFYTVRGYLSYLQYSRTGVGAAGKFYEVREQDAWGHVNKERRFGTSTNIDTTRSYHPTRGWIDTLVTIGASTLQNWDFDFDSNGNLTRRNSGNGNLVEDMSYDKLNRLTSVVLSGFSAPGLTTSITYDKLGNICARGSTSYSYEGADGCNSTSLSGRPHAVIQVGNTTYGYDQIGNQVVGNSSVDADDHTMGYDAFEQVVVMTRGSITAFPSAQETEFSYGSDLARYRRIDRTNGVDVRTTRYVGTVEFITTSTETLTKRYLPGGAVVTTSSVNSTVDDRYLLVDHLGSLDVVVGDTGALIESASFDVWGGRRNATSWQGASAAPASTTHGFTGHEHVDAIGLIHMNGRVYDPAIGRFIQSDPLVDSGIQGLNRYSYVLNNPLSLTDPTGNMSWGEWIRTGIGIAVAAATGGAASSVSLTAGQQVFVVGAGGAMSAAGTSMSAKGIGWGAISAVAFYGIGTYFENSSWASDGSHVFGTNLDLGGYSAKVLAHAVTGGVLQHMQGGRFGDGFASAGLSQAFSGAIDNLDPANPGFSTERVLVAAILGGVVSQVTGGKFANGAGTSAFARAFNDDIHWQDDQLELMTSIDLFFKKQPDGQFELNSRGLSILMKANLAVFEWKSPKVGGYKKIPADSFAEVKLGGGDGVFLLWADKRFRVTGVPRTSYGANLNGTFAGSDLNYVYQGILSAARGEGIAKMNADIAAWNGLQALQGVLSGNRGEALRNATQIQRASLWGTYGFYYYSSGEGR